MSSGTLSKVVVASVPVGAPKETDFRVETEAIPPISDGEFLVKTVYISPDPYQRGVLYRLKPGDTMVGSIVGEVIESKNEEFSVGTFVLGAPGWVSHAVVSPPKEGKKQIYTWRAVDPSIAPLSTFLGVMGMPGMTAYFGLLSITDPKEGETVVVSGAAGAVGSIVGQIAKLRGCRVVGTAGTDEKCEWLKDLGFDVAINYKTAESISDAIGAACPDGVDVFFDNVGGAINDAVLMRINSFARISICGQISQYNSLDNPNMGPRLLHKLIYTNSKMEGFVVARFLDKFPEAEKQMGAWISAGDVKYRETILEGDIGSVPGAFMSMLGGGNVGKQLVKIE